MSASSGLTLTEQAQARIDAARAVDGSEMKKSRKEKPPASKKHGNGNFSVSGKGVFYDDEANGMIWICDPLYVVAKTRNAQSEDWGRLLEWCDSDGVKHQWAMPLELLRGDSVDVRGELLRRGLSLAPGRNARELLAVYLQTWKVDNRARCIDRLGWHDDVFVTPSESIGQGDEYVVFQSGGAIEPAYAVKGTLDGWRDSVARFAAGNSRLVFALSAAFAGTLAEIVGEDSGGFHFRGTSSTGKSSALFAAASVWGSPEYRRLWRATANGLEGLAAVHNDGLLILDEISQIDPHEAGLAAYMLANGQGKTRASRTGAARKAAHWLVIILSAGEESLSALMAKAGKKANAGQEIRLADIGADAGAGMGAFETLNGQETPKALSEAVVDAARQNYGVAGVEWLRYVVRDKARLSEMLVDGIRQFVKEHAPADAGGQVLRVARRFGLVAVAGELATHYGLTGWQKDEAEAAAAKCFASWLDGFGGAGNREERNILSQVKAFFEMHGASSFENLHPENEPRIVIPNRAGFWRTGTSGEREYLVLPEAFKEICSGIDRKTAEGVLLKAGWITPGTDGRTTQKPRIDALGKPTRCYVFTGKMWESE